MPNSGTKLRFCLRNSQQWRNYVEEKKATRVFSSQTHRLLCLPANRRELRDDGQVHQRVLSTVGRLEALQASGQLDSLLRSGLRFCQKLAVIDAHAAARPNRWR